MDAFQSYFIPKLKSKYLTYEIFKYTYTYTYQVIILLRSLSKSSRRFMDKLMLEISEMFQVYQI